MSQMLWPCQMVDPTSTLSWVIISNYIYNEPHLKDPLRNMIHVVTRTSIRTSILLDQSIMLIATYVSSSNSYVPIKWWVKYVTARNWCKNLCSVKVDCYYTTTGIIKYYHLMFMILLRLM